MSMHPQAIVPIPEETVRVACVAFPRGNPYMTMRDQLGPLYDDQDFAALFSKRGRPAQVPWQLALACVFQKAHDLLKARGKKLTDSTHVLAAIRTLNRLESVGETLQAVLNAVASVAPGACGSRVV